MPWKLGLCANSNQEWKHIPKPDHTWNHWKEHFNNAFNELKEINIITMELMGYGTSDITEQMVAPDVAMALDNLASMTMSKTDAMDTLLVANK